MRKHPVKTEDMFVVCSKRLELLSRVIDGVKIKYKHFKLFYTLLIKRCLFKMS